MIHSILSQRERIAVQSALGRIYKELGSDQAIAERLSVSQQSINKARNHAVIGPLLASRLYDHLGMTRDAFLKKYAAPEDELMLDPSNTQHYAAIVRAMGRSMGMLPDEVDAFLTAARRHGNVPIERVAGALEAFSMTQQAARKGSATEVDAMEERTTPKLPRRSGR